MLELVKAGGWLMLPIILCSIVALAIVVERAWALRRERITPRYLVSQVWDEAKRGQLGDAYINEVRGNSPLGRVVATALVNRHHDRDVMKESVEEAGRHVVLELERYLNALGTIASITPLLGLLGTVIGMIKVFTAITVHGVGNPGQLAGGISEALITTAAGLSVAIPSLMFYRYYRGRVDELVVTMEQEALKAVEVLHGERERDPGGDLL